MINNKQHQEKMMKILLLVILTHSTQASFVEEKAIHNFVLNGYDQEVRPEGQEKESVVVRFDMRMQKLVNLDVRTQVLTINAFTMLRWTDIQLQWNKTKYNGTDQINMGGNLIWTPDVVLYNTADESSYSQTDLYKTKALVFSDGTVIWNSPVTWKISCEMDITWFPVDRQICHVRFGSQSYSKSQLKLLFWSKPTSKDGISADIFSVGSGEWEIDDLTAFEENIEFSCCPEEFSSIRYKFVFHRMSLYYFLYIILPLISLSFLFLLVFHIPCDSGERMGFGVTILLSITVYLLVISEKLPEKSNMYPMLGTCFIAVFYLLCVALGCAAMTTIFASRKHKPPEWIKKMALEKANCRKRKQKVNHNICTYGSQGRLETSMATFNGNDGETDGTHIDDDEEKKNDYSHEWLKICRWIDKRLFVLFNILIIFIPLVISTALPKSGLA